MIFESGMHFDFDKVGVVGPKAISFATAGTGFPIICALGYCVFLSKIGVADYPLMDAKKGYDGLAAGVSLAPTSVGIALKLLLESKQLQADYGQAIITGAFIDDIWSLIAFGVLA